MRIVVCGEIGRLDLLEEGGRMIHPKVVDIELSESDVSWKDQRPSWISVGGLRGF